RDDEALRADLERRLGRRVLQMIVNEVDYVRDTMTVDVRFRGAADDRRPRPAAPGAPLGALLGGRRWAGRPAPGWPRSRWRGCAAPRGGSPGWTASTWSRTGA